MSASCISPVSEPAYGRLGAMSLAIRQIHPVFVGEVSGVDLAGPLSSDEAAAIEAGGGRFAGRGFPHPKKTPEQQMGVCQKFGSPHKPAGGDTTQPADK